MFDCNLKFWWWWWWCRDCYSEQTGNSSGIMRLNSPGGSTLQWGSAPDLSCLAHALVVWRRGVGIAKLRDSQYCPKNICTNRIHLNVFDSKCSVVSFFLSACIWRRMMYSPETWTFNSNKSTINRASFHTKHCSDHIVSFKTFFAKYGKNHYQHLLDNV